MIFLHFVVLFQKLIFIFLMSKLSSYCIVDFICFLVFFTDFDQFLNLSIIEYHLSYDLTNSIGWVIYHFLPAIYLILPIFDCMSRSNWLSSISILQFALHSGMPIIGVLICVCFSIVIRLLNPPILAFIIEYVFAISHSTMIYIMVHHQERCLTYFSKFWFNSTIRRCKLNHCRCWVLGCPWCRSCL